MNILKAKAMSASGENVHGATGAMFSAARAVFATASLGAVAAVSGCAASGAAGAGYDRCPQGQERVRIGPRGQAPKYTCRDAD